jgi:hypothetical protein
MVVSTIRRAEASGGYALSMLSMHAFASDIAERRYVELGDAIAITVAHIDRTLQHLRSEWFVDLRGRTLPIPALDSLERFHPVGTRESLLTCDSESEGPDFQQSPSFSTQAGFNDGILANQLPRHSPRPSGSFASWGSSTGPRRSLPCNRFWEIESATSLDQSLSAGWLVRRAGCASFEWLVIGAPDNTCVWPRDGCQQIEVAEEKRVNVSFALAQFSLASQHQPAFQASSPNLRAASRRPCFAVGSAMRGSPR